MFDVTNIERIILNRPSSRIKPFNYIGIEQMIVDLNVEKNTST